MGRQRKAPVRSDLCADAHTALKGDSRRWKQAAFAGYQPLGRTLGEYRVCPACGSTVLRPASFVDALAEVLEHLSIVAADQNPPGAGKYGASAEGAGRSDSIVYMKSAALLSGWARENIPAWYGQASGPPEPPPSSPMAAAQSASSTRRRRTSHLRRGQPRQPDKRKRSVGASERVPPVGRAGE